jgi:hypothetical protein
MKRTLLFLSVCFCLALTDLSAQGFAFGVKGGLTIGIQNWEGFEMDPLFKYHGIFFLESISEEDRFALYSQLGFHQKGSALRNRMVFNNINGQPFRPPAREFIFNNISLGVGAKQKFEFGGENSKAYYLLGVRADYTADTNLDEYTRFIEANPSFAIYPIDDTQFIREFNYGITVGGGIEFALSEFIGTLIEFTVNPDFSLQYEQPEIPFIQDPWTGNTRSIPQRRIRNLTFEVTAGFRFLRKVEYID